MPGSPKFFNLLCGKLRNAKNRAEQDTYLDQWLHVRNHATEWDAVQWGFPEDWMREARAQMSRTGPMKRVAT